MKRIAKVFLLLIAGLFILTGCGSEEEFARFTLQTVSGVSMDDEQTPTSYMVNAVDAENQVIIYKNERISEMELGRAEERYDLEDVTVTDEEITIQYDGQVDTFSRLSESVVESEEGIWYEYYELGTERRAVK